ncbi:unnamed protein product, partial [Mesorhabditis spiculigera]
MSENSMDSVESELGTGLQSASQPLFVAPQNPVADSKACLERVRQLKRKANELIGDLNQITKIQETELLQKKKRRSAVYLDGYKRRLDTFQSLNWKFVPELPARELAEKGWQMKGPESVECPSCSRFVSVVLPNIVEVPITVYNACISHVREKLTTAHENTCLFRSPPVDYFPELRNSPKNLKKFYQMSLDALRRVDFGEAAGHFDELDPFIRAIFGELRPNELLPAAYALLHWRPKSGTLTRLECELCARDLTPKILPDFSHPSSQHYACCPLLDKGEDGDTPVWKEMAQLCVKPAEGKVIADLYRVETKMSKSLSNSSLNNI